MFILELVYLLFIQIREDVKSGIYVENLTEEHVFTMKDVNQLLIKVCFLSNGLAIVKLVLNCYSVALFDPLKEQTILNAEYLSGVWLAN